MPIKNRGTDILLLSDAPERAAMLQQLLEANAPCGPVHTLRLSRRALARIRQSGRYAGRPLPNIVLMDLADADVPARALVDQLASAAARRGIPTILFTSRASEAALADGVLACCGPDCFAATPLYDFLRNMQQHSQDRFARALQILARLGPIRVCLPESLAGQPDDLSALTA